MRIGVYGLFFFMVGYARWTKDLCQRQCLPSVTLLTNQSHAPRLFLYHIVRSIAIAPIEPIKHNPIPSLPRRIARLSRATEQEAHLL